MKDSEAEEEFREVANSRSNNSMVWTGFAVTQFTLVVSIFSAFGLEIGVTLQLALSLFLVSGIAFTLAYSLYETAGSSYKLRLPVDAHPYKIWKFGIKENEKSVPNPREIFVKQAEACNTLGIYTWSAGIAILLWNFALYFALLVWISALIIGSLFALPRSSLLSKR